ncbi:hypothetical protein VV11_020575 [Trichodesmium erythraeum 21-75]|nr:hypothetical protein [Trichodesmium erythraeum 21-75]
MCLFSLSPKFSAKSANAWLKTVILILGKSDELVCSCYRDVQTGILQQVTIDIFCLIV